MALRRPTGLWKRTSSQGAPRTADFSAHAWSVLVPSCVAIALLATALFFFLHHIGNQLPYDLAVERFAEELASARPDEGHAKGYKSMFEYCQMSSAVLAGAAGARNSSTTSSALRNAVVLKESNLGDANRRHCHALKAAVNGSAVPEVVLKTRYWWGGKALYAIALRYGSVHEIREFTRWGTRIAYVLLAISLLLLSPKMLLLAAPLVVFGAFFSGIDYWADAANGLPYLWTVLFAACLALLTRRDTRVGGSQWWSGTVPVYCFAAGTVSSYLWLGDGHTFLVVTWIGMVVWFGSCLSPSGRPSCCPPPPAKSQSVHRARAAGTKRAALCIVLYGAGIVVCYAIGQAVKAMFLGYERVLASFWNGLVRNAGDTWLLSTSVTQTRDAMDVSAYLSTFYAVYWPEWLPAHTVPTTIAVFSLVASLGFAAFEARRGRRDLLWSTLWIVGLMSISSLTFLIVEHLHYRTARFAFVPLALCLSCLVLCARSVDWRASLATRWELPVLLVVAGCVSWQLARSELSAVAKIIESVEDVQPIIRSHYDVYLDGKRLVYVREECGDEDDDATFFLHLYPVDVAELPDSRQPHEFDNLDFYFLSFGFRDQRCTALLILPDYALAAIHTGQYVQGEGRLWEQRVDLESPQRGSARGAPLARRSPQRGSARGLPLASKNLE